MRRALSAMWRPVGIGLLAAAPALLEARHGCFPFDEGMLLYSGHSLLGGEGLYEHVRVNCGPGIVWVVAAIFAVFGESFLAVRLFMAALFVALVFLFRSTLRTLGAPHEADLVAIGLVGARAFLHPHWLMVSYTSLSIFAYVAVLRLLLGATPRFGAAGAAAAAAFAFKQNVGGMSGLLLLAAILVLPGVPRGVALLRAAGAGLAVSGAAAMGIAWRGSLRGFFEDAIAGNARMAEHWHLPFPLLMPAAEILEGDSTFFYVPSRLVGLMFRFPAVHSWAASSGALVLGVRIAYALPLVVVGAALVQGARGRRREPRRLLVAMAAAILLLMAWPVATILHWSNASLGALLAAGSVLAGTAWRRRALGAGMLLLLATGLGTTAASVLRERTALRLSIGTVMTSPGIARRVEAVLGYLDAHARPDDRIFVVPYAPLYYLIAGRDNAIAEDYVIPPWCDARRLAAIADELEQRKVRYVIWTESELPKFPRFADYGRPLADAIRQRYRPVFRSPPGGPRDTIWERRDDPSRGPSPPRGPSPRRGASPPGGVSRTERAPR